MREAYLTGGNEHFDATDAPATTEAATAPLWQFTSVALTEEYNLTVTGARYGAERDEFTITRYCKPHPDLLKALRQLTLHMCLLTEEVSARSLYPQPSYMPFAHTDRTATQALREAMLAGDAYVHPDLEKYRCLSVQWKSKGVVLKGTKKSRYLLLGGELEVKTPPVEVRLGLLDDEEEPAEWEYPYFEQMDEALRDLISELTAFMGGKYGEGGQQLELFGREAPAPSVLEALDNLTTALDAELSQRRHYDATEAEEATLAATEAAMDAPTTPTKKRPARRTGQKGGQQHG